MKKSLLFLSLAIILVVKSINAQPSIIDTRLSLVGNTFNFPVQGVGTLVVNVEAISVVGDAQINQFENAFQIDSALIGQIPSVTDVTFSNQHFPAGIFGYTYTEIYSPADGSISYRYQKGGLAPYAVIPAVWTVIVTVTIEYTMVDAVSTISWFDGPPDFHVTNQAGNQIQREEIKIPPELENFPLPVELNSFSGIAKGNAVELSWQTETEVNNFGFEIERLAEEQQSNGWQKIGFVEGNGNSNSKKNYVFTDKNPAGGNTFHYRLKQIDNDGKIAYSFQTEVELTPKDFELFQNYPNPFNPETSIKFSIPKASRVSLDVYNIKGEHVLSLLNKDMDAGFHIINFNGENLVSGVYIYRIKTNNFVKHRKMLLVK